MSSTRGDALWSKGPFTLYRRELKVVGKTEATTNQIKVAAKEILEQRDAGAWGIGDLCVYAEGIGKNEPVDTIAEELVRDRQMVRKCYYVSKAIGADSRTFDLWWSFYFAVYTYPEDVRNRLLALAEDEKWTLEEFKKHLRDIRHTVRTEQQDFPEGTYGLIYADPAWEYEGGTTDPSRQIDNQYPTMKLEEIRDLSDPRGRGVADLCAPACILYLWTPNAKLEEALSVMAAWGFEYRTNMAWVKDLQGMGVWARQRHELLLIGVKGEVVPPHESLRPDSVIQEPVREHSQKPDYVYDMLETLYRKMPKIELFARRPRDGWDSWGNQLPAATDQPPAETVDPETGDVTEAGAEQAAREKDEKKVRKPEPKKRVSESASSKNGAGKKKHAKKAGPGGTHLVDPRKKSHGSEARA
jgi:N6-adenosine-specific RNA methylase IME4